MNTPQTNPLLEAIQTLLRQPVARVTKPKQDEDDPKRQTITNGDEGPEDL